MMIFGSSPPNQATQTTSRRARPALAGVADSDLPGCSGSLVQTLQLGQTEGFHAPFT